MLHAHRDPSWTDRGKTDSSSIFTGTVPIVVYSRHMLNSGVRLLGRQKLEVAVMTSHSTARPRAVVGDQPTTQHTTTNEKKKHTRFGTKAYRINSIKIHKASDQEKTSK
jgi:hypothetical protein